MTQPTPKSVTKSAAAKPVKSATPTVVKAEVAKPEVVTEAEVSASVPIQEAAPVVIEAPVVEPVIESVKTEAVAEAPAPVSPLKGLVTMNDTVKQVQETMEKFTTDATAKVKGYFEEASEKTKAAYEKGAKLTEDAVTFQKENVEAVVASSKLAAAGAEKAAQHVAELSRKHFEEASAAIKAAASAKTPGEFFTLQGDYMKSSYEALIAETTKSSETMLKFFGEVFQPISSRAAVAAEKVKSATTF